MLTKYKSRKIGYHTENFTKCILVSKYVCTYLGASAGIFALSTAHIASMILNYNEDIAVQRTRWRNKIKFPTVRAFGRGIR